MTTMTRVEESTSSGVCLLMAFELSQRTWKVGFTVGAGERVRMRTVPAGDRERVRREIAEAKARFQLAAATPVVSCYEAGREAFWLHRWLTAEGVTNYVVDSSSIEVPRRARQTKTDRLDLIGLLRLLTRHVQGARGVWHVVRVPSCAEEDARHRSRQRETIQQERTRLINRLRGLLASQGLVVPLRADFLDRLTRAQLWDGSPVPTGLAARLRAVWEQLQVLATQLAALDAGAARAADEATRQCVARLDRVRGVGAVGAWSLATEIFAWRGIRNGRELGALVGLVPAPYQSGATARDRGITRAGNRHVRRMMVQLAWSWLRYQPRSALSQWYRARFDQGRRLRRIGIVALARKLLIALWRYLETDQLPEGAQLKSSAA